MVARTAIRPGAVAGATACGRAELVALGETGTFAAKDECQFSARRHLAPQSVDSALLKTYQLLIPRMGQPLVLFQRENLRRKSPRFAQWP